MKELLNYPFDGNAIIRKKRAIKKELLTETDFFTDYHVAILGGSTTSELRDILELFLLKKALRPSFYESGYNRFLEEGMFENPRLDSFKPHLVFIHSGIVNIESYPDFEDSEDDVETRIKETTEKYNALWTRLFEKYHCEIIQNNFELPQHRLLGNLDCVDHRGRVNFIEKLNMGFSSAARTKPYLHINDVHYLSSSMGLQEWFDPSYWFLYKYALSYKAIPYFCHNVANIIDAIYGKSKKVVVLDLDNTLWGGVIGDDGVQGIKLGKDDPAGEAYCDFQTYLKSLKNRGVMLAICSKNDIENVQEGLSHPDSILKMTDFTSIKATWGPKDEAIKKIGEELNVGRDSMVFVDDNPAERALVRGNVPEVAVPEIGNDIVCFSGILDHSGFFEAAALSGEDIRRSEYYVQNTARNQNEGAYANHDAYLKSLNMSAEIGEFNKAYLERITQLTNKTNQFNLTVKRYTQAEMEDVLGNPAFIGLYGKLQDKFGDNGLVSVMLGRIEENTEVHIDLWVMSCRVFNREMEFAMFDEFVDQCLKKDLGTIYGYYFPSAKNGIVSDLYSRIGFDKVGIKEAGSTVWAFKPTKDYKKNSDKIALKGGLHGND